MSEPEPGFEPSRLSALRRGEKLLVMDRETGRSAYIPASSEPLLKLLALPAERLTPELETLRTRVAGELRAQGIGAGSSPEPRHLNTVILKLTSACNYACTYCYDFEPEDATTHLSVDMALEAIAQALVLAPQGLQVIFHGGEPFLLFDRIEQIVLSARALAARAGKRIEFTGQTNLSLLDERSVRFSLEHQLHWGFSLDGPPRQNTLRVSKNGAATHGDFQQALERFPEFVRASAAMATITAVNQEELLGLSRYFQGCGLRGWDWSLFQPIGRGRRQELSLDASRLVKAWNDLFDAVVDGEFDGFAVSPVLKYTGNFLFGPGRNMCLRRRCGAARDLLSVSANGRLEACDCIDPHGPLSNLGNLARVSLAQARQSEVARRIRSRDVTKGKCGHCIWLAVCGGTCMARSPNLHGVDELECQVSLNAFDRISASLADSTRLRDYWSSLHARADRGSP
ncbi:radical SAM/SPASM domain-containing protein [Archangium violaceum]|uniref:Uncharacterized protein n=1 Tax=Archangium violaceum Cb vi76 TaxID=1406225 RepID=A0A084SNW6_9BACT|nr:radical SAM protein [Archangium violaceum]KFA90151.1 hypothetical protein Q664_29695 [Archangium violaceum Cb vi76]